MRPMRPTGFVNTTPRALYNLDVSKIEYNKNFATRFLYTTSENRTLGQKAFRYNEENQSTELDFREVIMFFDTPNGTYNNNLFCAPSRLDAVTRNILNIDTALISERNALSKAGLFVMSGSKDGKMISKPLDAKEKKDIENKVSQYGNGKGRGNVIATNSKLDIQSMHIPMSQLGIPESIRHNALMIMRNMGIPKDLYPMVADNGAKYDNLEQAMVMMVQNTIQDEANDFCNTITSTLKLDFNLTASFDHLPCMQVIEDKKADKALKLSQVYRNVQDQQTADAIMEIAGINQEG